MSNKCISGKRLYADKQLAEEALIQHHIRNEFSNHQGPINVYQCEECGNWHFTSKGNKNILLDDEEVVKRIGKERLAFQWERKFR